MEIEKEKVIQDYERIVRKLEKIYLEDVEKRENKEISQWLLNDSYNDLNNTKAKLEALKSGTNYKVKNVSSQLISIMGLNIGVAAMMCNNCLTSRFLKKCDKITSQIPEDNIVKSKFGNINIKEEKIET